MWRHTKECHGGVRGPDSGVTDYRMWFDSSWTSPMDRQIVEGLKIGSLEAESYTGTVRMLNCKSDFCQSRSVQLDFRQGLLE